MCFERQSTTTILHIVFFWNKPIIAEAIAWAGVCLSCSIIKQKLMACWQYSWLSLMLYGCSDIRCIIQKPDPTHHKLPSSCSNCTTGTVGREYNANALAGTACIHTCQHVSQHQNPGTVRHSSKVMSQSIYYAHPSTLAACCE